MGAAHNATWFVALAGLAGLRTTSAHPRGDFGGRPALGRRPGHVIVGEDRAGSASADAPHRRTPRRPTPDDCTYRSRFGEWAAGQIHRGRRQRDVTERLTGPQSHVVIVPAGAEREQNRIVVRFPGNPGKRSVTLPSLMPNPPGSGNDGQLHAQSRRANVQQLKVAGGIRRAGYRRWSARAERWRRPVPGERRRGLLDHLQDGEVAGVPAIGEPPNSRRPACGGKRHDAVVQHRPAAQQYIAPIRR